MTRKSGPKQDEAWHDLCRRAQRMAAVNLYTTPLPAAVDAVLQQIEMRSTAQNLVRLASLLIQLEAASLTSADPPDAGTQSQPLVQREQARRRAEALVRHQEIHGHVIPQAKPTIGEPEEPSAASILDLVRVKPDAQTEDDPPFPSLWTLSRKLQWLAYKARIRGGARERARQRLLATSQSQQ